MRVTISFIVRRRRLILTWLVAIALTVPAAFIFSSQPERYRASAVIYVESRPGRVPVFQEMSPTRPLAVSVGILESESLAEAVLENLPMASRGELFEVSDQSDPPSIRTRRALAQLRSAVSFEPARDNSGIIRISAETRLPSLSVEVVNAYVEAIMSRTRSFNIDDVRVSREFLEQQVADVGRSIIANERAIHDLLLSRDGVKPADESRDTVERLARTKGTLNEKKASRNLVQARVDVLRKEGNSAEQVNTLQTTSRSLLVEEATLQKQIDEDRQLLKRLSDAEIAYDRLSRDLTSQRSLFSRLQDQLMAARVREQGEMKVVKVVDPPRRAIPLPSPWRMRALFVVLAIVVAFGVSVPLSMQWGRI